MAKERHSYPMPFMMDAVKYADENGDRRASLQFGVKISKIGYWRRTFSKSGSKSPYLKCSPLFLMKDMSATSSRKYPVLMDHDDKILADWLSEEMDQGHFPTQSQIGLKAGELNLRHPLRSKCGAAALLHRSDLHKRWIVGARLRRPVKTPYSANSTVKQSVTLTDQAYLEKALAEWITTRLNCDQRPTLTQIAARYTELAEIHRISIADYKNPSAFADQLLKKTGLRDRWQAMLYGTNGRIEKLVRKWLDGMLKSGQKPTPTQIAAKYQVLAKRKKIKVTPIKDQAKFASKLLGKRGLQWSGVVEPVKISREAVEQQLLDWLKAEFPNGNYPPRKDIIAKAFKIMRELNIRDFNPSIHWYRRFKEKFKQIDADASTSNIDLPEDQTSPLELGQMEPNDDADAGPSSHHSTLGNGDSDYQVDDEVDEAIQTDYRHDDGAEFLVHTTVTHVDLSTRPELRKAEATNFSPSCTVELMDMGNSHHEAIKIQQSSNQNVEELPDDRPVVKRKFGSFHSSNLDEQLQFAESDCYVPVELPVRPPKFEMYTNSDCKFGSIVRKKHFFLEQGCLFLNHGAFGGALKEALDYYHDWQRYLETQPLRFFDRILFPQIVHVQKRLADFIGCKASEITFTTNVTTAINAVLQGLPLNEESSIYYLSLTYGAVKKMIKHVCARTGAKAIEVAVTLPLSKPDDIVSLVRSTLKSTTTLAIFDHIPSNYAFIMPVKELVSVCHQRGVQVLIDGAHGLGQLHLDLSILGADYYMGNCHKWFCSPKGCAFMYVNKQLQRLTRGLIISHGYDDGFHSQFAWTGAKDYCSYLSLHALINFWTIVGPEKIRQYCKSLLKEVADYFKLKWSAWLLAPIEYHGMMCCISLPSVLYSGKDVSYNDAEAIQNRLYSEFNIEVPIKCIEKKLYVRISAHIYNEFSEYATLASAILQIADTSK